MANVYNRGKKEMGDKWEWDVDSFKCMLVTSTYTYDADHATRSVVTNEITNSGYSAGGNAMSGCTVIQDDTGDQAKYDATDVTFTSLGAGDQPYAAIVYQDTGAAATDGLIAYCVLTTPPAPDGNNYKIVWHADGVFKITDS